MKKQFILLLVILTVFNCKNEKKDNGKLNVVTTTTMITDLVKNIGGDAINVEGLMGSGVDPHLYKASEGDVTKLFNADIIFYNGLHLEGKLVEVFEKMGDQAKTPIALADDLDKSGLIGSDYFASSYDPHVWFNIDYFKQFAEKVTEVLSEKNPEHNSFILNLMILPHHLHLHRLLKHRLPLRHLLSVLHLSTASSVRPSVS